ncbi:MAG: 30S ribosomal protein S1 [Deltaproteobacteria bacterium]|nr:30S ribosomal protein S1 [Deltaproteobacteria bacterium]
MTSDNSLESKGDSPKENFAELFENSLKRELAQEGDIVTGTVIKMTPDYAVIDFSYKCEGTVPLSEFAGARGEVALKEGDTVDVYFEMIDEETGLAVLSKTKADALKVWDNLVEISEKEGVVEGTVLCKVKGGLSVDVGVKAFLPGSQIDIRPVTQLDRLVGKKFKFKILKLNKRKGNIIVSRRALLEQDRGAYREESLQNVREGEVVAGHVKNITDYGVFVDLGGVDGLLHITDMTWGRIGHPSEVCKIGSEIKVKILKVDPESGKVSLGLKQLLPDPWEGVEKRYVEGGKIKGKVVNLTDYGAFLELERGVEGLVHVSEMSWNKKVRQPSKILSLGDLVEAVILDLDPAGRRISLGMKQVLPNPWETLAEKYPIGTKFKGEVKNTTDFGFFIGLSEEIDGLVHISDLSWVKPWRHPQELYKKGDTLEVVVLNIDKDNERFSLGVKQLTEDIWPQVQKEYAVGEKVKGTLVSVGEKGVIVELQEGVEGFIAKTDFPEEKQANPEEHFKLKEKLDVVVHSLDEREHKITLGLHCKGAGSSKEEAKKKVKGKKA